MTIRQPRYSKEEFARRGDEIYESQVRQSDVFQIGDIVAGRIVAIEQTGVLVDFEMDRPIHVPLVELSINEIQAPEDVPQLNEVREFL